ncbi:MAG: aminotransferase class I/II-fold pyridoxal phosphate-dependent enzyme [Alicyclobacillaceae bacterium]|nr:aminotransferase class I/II-fold pyridoxal phosphate-dependent enzyme [Alicyclobacillaceae bacterium]
MKGPATRLQQVKSAIFSELDKRKKQRTARGEPVIDLSIGSPDLAPHPKLRQMLQEIVEQESVYGYPGTEGTKAFREAVASWMEWRFGVRIDPEEQTLALIGSQDGLSHLALAWLDRGDVALVPDPCYPIYQVAVQLAGAELYPVPLRAEHNYWPDFSRLEAVGSRAKWLILNYPNNPLGATADLAQFEEAVWFARRHDLLLVHDAAYSELAFDTRPPSVFQIPGAEEVAVEFHSLSKSFNLAGCRIAAAVGRKDALQALRVLKSNIDYGVFLPVQQVAALALTELREVPGEYAAVYRRRRDRFLAEAEAIGWHIPPSRGTMFIWAPVPNGHDDQTFAYDVLDRAGVCVVPGTAFGAEGRGYVRIALVQPEEILAEAVRRIGQMYNV